jgi:outer membrane protein W
MISKRAMVGWTLATSLVVGAPAPAQEEGGWTVRLSAVGMAATGDGDETAMGIGTGVEYRWSRRVGLELGVNSAELQTEPVPFLILADDGESESVFPLELESSVRLTPLLARVNFHLTPGRRLDLYVAPVVGYVHVSDDVLRVRAFGFEHEAPLEAKDAFAWGGAFGFDVPLGQRGSQLSVAATWLRLPLESELFGEEERADLDPLTVTAGYGFRF